MTNSTTTIINQEETDLSNYFSKEELDETVQELAYIETHIEEYKKNNNMKDLIKELNIEVLNK